MQPNATLNQPTQADIDFVVREFSNHVRRDEIKQAIMMRSGLSWSEAEEFVSYVEQNHRRNIAARQMPLLLFLAIGALIVGCVLLIYGAWQLQSGIPLSPLGMRRLVGTVAAGAALTIGGVIGLIQTLASLRG